MRLYTDDVKNQVENTVMSWLFGARVDDDVERPREVQPQR
jgi:hypothetical protein